MAGSSTQIWAHGPQICNVDPHMMPHYKFQAVCDYEHGSCEKVIPFTMELGRDLRHHYKERHRLRCKACNMESFSSRKELEDHFTVLHPDGFCFKCQASFSDASALAMHIEDRPRNSCSVSDSALVNVLRFLLPAVRKTSDPNAVYKPIKCSPAGVHGGEQRMVRQLRDFKSTLYQAHQLASTAAGMAPGTNQLAVPSPFGSQALVITGPSTRARLDHCQPENRGSQAVQWTCTTCVEAGRAGDANFASLTKLLQHVEGKLKDLLYSNAMNN